MRRAWTAIWAVIALGGCVVEDGVGDLTFACEADVQCASGYGCDVAAGRCRPVAELVETNDATPPDATPSDATPPDATPPDASVECAPGACCDDLTGRLAANGAYCEEVMGDGVLCRPDCAEVSQVQVLVGRCQAGVCQIGESDVPLLRDEPCPDGLVCSEVAQACVPLDACQPAPPDTCAGRDDFSFCAPPVGDTFARCLVGVCEPQGCLNVSCNPTGPHMGILTRIVQLPRIEPDLPAGYFVDLAVGDPQHRLQWELRPDQAVHGWAEAIEFCRNKGADWRLPDLFELYSLVELTDRRIDVTLPAGVNLASMESTGFWSSTGKHTGETVAWWVDFSQGGSSPAVAVEFKRAWCVRGPQRPRPTDRFVHNDSEGAIDSWTGLRWSLQPDELVDVTQADTVCQEKQMRLPALMELVTLLDFRSDEGPQTPIGPIFDPNLAGSYWTQTETPTGSPLERFVVDFGAGVVLYGDGARRLGLAACVASEENVEPGGTP